MGEQIQQQHLLKTRVKEMQHNPNKHIEIVGQYFYYITGKTKRVNIKKYIYIYFEYLLRSLYLLT